jgi:MFS family permease
MKQTALFTPVLIAGCIIVMLSFAVRASFGVFQIPVAEEFGWLRTEFSMAIALQNLFWGIGQPIFGAIADKMTDRKAIVLGGLVYALGLVLSSTAVTPGAMQLYGILVGFGIAGTGFGVILAIATAAGSAGQVIGAPLAEYLLSFMVWQNIFITFAAIVIGSLIFLPMMKTERVASKAELEESIGQVLMKAFKDPSYSLIFLGFFSCGYQLAFITAHFPAFVTELCGPIMPGGALHSIGITTTSRLGALAISLIGIANIIGTLTAGYLGKRYSKKYLLAGIYLGRTVIAALFIALPITPMSVVIFSFAMGSLWLATVPLTSGLVAHIYGLRYMGTLYGIVFFSHQLGSFLGVWLGGKMYDIYGTYTAVWWVGVGVGLFSAIVHLPIKERPLHVVLAKAGV